MSDLSKLQNKFLSIAKSKEPYPVDFDEAWKWIGYSRKDHGKTILIEYFQENIDYSVFLISRENSKGGRPKEKISLSIECFKKFAMIAQTKKGYEVRNYYLEVESKLLEIVNDSNRKEIRDKSKKARNTFTDTLKRHGVDKPGHYICITKDMKKVHNITSKKDDMSTRDLQKTLLSETLASIRMTDQSVDGFYEARPVCIDSSKQIEELVENKSLPIKQNLFGISDI